MGKLFERVIADRLAWHLQGVGLNLADNQALSWGKTPMPRQIATWRTELRCDLMAVWKDRLSQPSARHAAIARPIFEEWLERRHGVLAFCRTQVITGHGYFGTFVFRIRRDESAGCYHCVARPEDTVGHTVEVFWGSKLSASVGEP